MYIHRHRQLLGQLLTVLHDELAEKLLFGYY